MTAHPDESKQTATILCEPRQGTLRSVLIALGIVGLGLIGLYLLRSFAATLLLIFAGILFGIFLHGLTVLAKQWLHLTHGVALPLVVALIAGSFALFIWLAGPQVASQLQLLGRQLPESITVLQSQLQQTEWGRALLAGVPSLSSLQLSFTSVLGSISHFFSITVELVGALVFIFFVGLYLAASPELYLRGSLLLLPRLHRARGREVMGAVGHALRWWLIGRAITMTLMSILTTLALWWANVPLALVLGVITGLLLFVPSRGGRIGHSGDAGRFDGRPRQSFLDCSYLYRRTRLRGLLHHALRAKAGGGFTAGTALVRADSVGRIIWPNGSDFFHAADGIGDRSHPNPLCPGHAG